MEPSRSPHTLQNPNSYYSESFTRILGDKFPQLQYSSRRGCDKTAVHFGQRSLLISEIEFLTIALSKLDNEKKLANKSEPTEDLVHKFSNLNVKDDESKILVVYAGAAAGKHLRLLIELFPSLTYLFIDPAQFHETYYEFSNVTIDNSLMTNNKATEIKKKYKDYKILYISDIRDSRFERDNDRQPMLESNEIVTVDLMKQREWYEILEPEFSCLKFRLPYPEKQNSNQRREFEYLDGEIYFLPWSTNTSTETRLFVKKNAKTKIYDIIKYEQQMFRHNVHERVLCYKHDIQSIGIDHCYDCFSEVTILKQYFEYNPNSTKTINTVIERVNYFLQTPYERLVRMYYHDNEYDVPFNAMHYGISTDMIFNHTFKQLASKRGPEYKTSKYGAH